MVSLKTAMGLASLFFRNCSNCCIWAANTVLSARGAVKRRYSSCISVSRSFGLAEPLIPSLRSAMLGCAFATFPVSFLRRSIAEKLPTPPAAMMEGASEVLNTSASLTRLAPPGLNADTRI